jgi:hypothetical protein
MLANSGPLGSATTADHIRQAHVIVAPDRKSLVVLIPVTVAFQFDGDTAESTSHHTRRTTYFTETWLPMRPKGWTREQAVLAAIAKAEHRIRRVVSEECGRTEPKP